MTAAERQARRRAQLFHAGLAQLAVPLPKALLARLKAAARAEGITLADEVARRLDLPPGPAQAPQEPPAAQWAGREGRTLDETETEEYDGLEAEVKAVDGHLVRLLGQTLEALERENLPAATARALRASAKRALVALLGRV